MKILIVCSRSSGKVAPFISDQVDALNKEGVNTTYFFIEQKGLTGYLKSRKLLLQSIKKFQPDLIHAHYGLSGLLANLQRKTPVVTTYHGSDINNDNVFRWSQWSIRFSSFNIFVSKKNLDKAHVKKKFALIPCGVDMHLFNPVNKEKARKNLGLNKQEKLVLFAGAFDNNVKNAKLALEVIEHIGDCRLLELKGYSRQEVAELMSAVDVALMTSLSEGSPQFIKEAMACNCPIVSVDVGDIKEVVGETDGCFVSSYDVIELTSKLKQALNLEKRTNGRERILKLGLNSKNIAKKIKEIYLEVCDSRKK